ncbi:MAG: hypothetical protein LH702_11445 [Phormidesmis sp. CAN_BIN44]|nr:hypothetical protein [Phormidesmis sp. CAN_BIN44]
MNRFIRLSQPSASASSLHVSLFEDDRVYGCYSAVCVYQPCRKAYVSPLPDSAKRALRPVCRWGTQSLALG